MTSPFDPTCWLTITSSLDDGDLFPTNNGSISIWQFGPILPFELYCISEIFVVYLAATCWLLCDYVDTVRDEATYVWKQPFCLGSFLFYFLRYGGIISLLVGFTQIAMRPQTLMFHYACDNPLTPDALELRPTKANIGGFLGIFLESSRDDLDRWSYTLAPALQFPVFWLVEVVMQMRIYALYKSKVLAVVNGALFVVEILAMGFLCLATSALAQPMATPSAIGTLPESPSLITTEVGIMTGWPIYWSPAIAFEFWLAGLAAAKLRRKVMKRELIGVLLRDSLLYFIMIAVFLVLHTVLGYYNLSGYAVPLLIVGETVGGSRLVLHLRKAYYGRSLPGTGATHPDISFAMPVRTSFLRSRRVIDESFYDMGE